MCSPIERRVIELDEFRQTLLAGHVDIVGFASCGCEVILC